MVLTMLAMTTLGAVALGVVVAFAVAIIMTDRSPFR